MFKQSLRLHFEAREKPLFMYIFIEPMSDEEIEAVQSRNEQKSKDIMAELQKRPLADEEEEAEWKDLRAKVNAEISKDHPGYLDETNLDEIEEYEDDDKKPGFELRLLRVQLGAESLKNGVQKLQLRQDEGEDVSSEIMETDADTTFKKREADCVHMASSLYQLRRKLRSLRGEIEEENGDDSKLLAFADLTEELIDSQLGKIADMSSHLVRNEDIQRKTALANEEPAEPKLEQSSITVEAKPSSTKSKERRLLALTLIPRNKVNGAFVERPEIPFTAADDWTIDYDISTIDSPAHAWRLYEKCKIRREDGYDPRGLPLGVLKSFQQKSETYAQQGRTWRKELESREEEGESDAVVFEPWDSGREKTERRDSGLMGVIRKAFDIRQ